MAVVLEPATFFWILKCLFCLSQVSLGGLGSPDVPHSPESILSMARLELTPLTQVPGSLQKQTFHIQTCQSR